MVVEKKFGFVRRVGRRGAQVVITVPRDVARVLEQGSLYQVELRKLEEEEGDAG